ncbi:MAG: hypothetical protein A3G52_00005 [Candidatus Taylorbacteria bacterium RIFCSPLOWO2_12_FULL_43_20]|uniref:AB hydrolase-1 domain-containing protein n=1 Tax=Candidatus Taylorbacteria bacterium RIFCSPLOWO2_12_FULL_43_20 TaxID=1802332 RepID=A0A1G2P2L4_9BACT|nr:MAG: hypothetical protein A2825_03060 [Candidatus Taylorbacteria bacterium RIFCSPHIGHO2_01_FULL_43_120]OHA22945.1 MAG: hypothetical protein A3B98_02795 [Candidatus Taylorbacteria bacterium RIFCSPHIGHO2_02_FULL_43_55]OHA30184.1 MAG: hypothetical protein A3E92_01160 [Candidatus Taylorbacteria bacterium RIFCSPHIGHO2_12_FULL_42_34]OHA31931.1 MAG: hypothetical protein A3B09_00915 [Candidatus Taylorbacteria bacterium RIFCSPLOWO2_01_FULL_43_83]OHA37954.1 MAG: hypothetical protein A3H58_01330 [Candi
MEISQGSSCGIKRGSIAGIAYYECSDYGTGVPILFVHGLCGDKELFTRWLTSARDMKINSYALDLRGHGESGGKETLGRLSLEEYCGNVLLMINHVIQRPVILVGHSMGAVCCQKIAAEHPKNVSVLVSLMSSAPRGVRPRGALVRRALHPYYLKALWKEQPFVFRTAEEYFFLNRIPRDIGKGLFKQESGRATKQLILGKLRVDKPIKPPHIVVSGKYDLAAPPSQQRAIQLKFRTLWHLELNTGHMPMLEPNAEENLKQILIYTT